MATAAMLILLDHSKLEVALDNLLAIDIAHALHLDKAKTRLESSQFLMQRADGHFVEV